MKTRGLAVFLARLLRGLGLALVFTAFFIPVFTYYFLDYMLMNDESGHANKTP